VREGGKGFDNGDLADSATQRYHERRIHITLHDSEHYSHTLPSLPPSLPTLLPFLQVNFQTDVDKDLVAGLRIRYKSTLIDNTITRKVTATKDTWAKAYQEAMSL